MLFIILYRGRRGDTESRERGVMRVWFIMWYPVEEMLQARYHSILSHFDIVFRYSYFQFFLVQGELWWHLLETLDTFQCAFTVILKNLFNILNTLWSNIRWATSPDLRTPWIKSHLEFWLLCRCESLSKWGQQTAEGTCSLFCLRLSFRTLFYRKKYNLPDLMWRI